MRFCALAIGVTLAFPAAAEETGVSPDAEPAAPETAGDASVAEAEAPPLPPDPTAASRGGVLLLGPERLPQQVQMDLTGTTPSDMGRSCAGIIPVTPDLDLFVPVADLGPIEVRLDSAEADPTLAIFTPDGEWLCDDDGGGGLNAAIRIHAPEPGRYAVFLGTFAPPEGAPQGRLTVRALEP